MSESVLGESPPALRKKYEQLITELVRQRDATRRLQVQAARLHSSVLRVAWGVRNAAAAEHIEALQIVRATF